MILAVDPGTTKSGWCLYRAGQVVDNGILDNPDMLERLDRIALLAIHNPHYVLAVEMVASYGMPVGAEVFRTVWWTGRFAERWIAKSGRLPVEVSRKEAKLHLCGSARAKDSNVRQALIDLYGGKEAAIGKKAAPGPLYGVKSHAWAALAVAVTASAQLEQRARAA